MVKLFLQSEIKEAFEAFSQAINLPQKDIDYFESSILPYLLLEIQKGEISENFLENYTKTHGGSQTLTYFIEQKYVIKFASKRFNHLLEKEKLLQFLELSPNQAPTYAVLLESEIKLENYKDYKIWFLIFQPYIKVLCNDINAISIEERRKLIREWNNKANYHPILPLDLNVTNLGYDKNNQPVFFDW